MITAQPFVEKRSILAAYRPGEPDPPSSLFKSLRHRRLCSAGIAVRVRGSDGRIHGSARLYCALNVDAARLSRLDKDGEARRLAREAKRVETTDEARELAATVERRVTDLIRGIDKIDTSSILRNALIDVSAGQFSSLALDLARHVEAFRATSGVLAANERLFAQILEVRNNVVHLRTLQGALFDMPKPLLDPAMLRPGAALALQWEQLGIGRQLLFTEPALKVTGVAAARGTSPKYPFTQGARPETAESWDALLKLISMRKAAPTGGPDHARTVAE